MNERIKLLAEKAGSTHKQNLGVYQFYSDELENFVELIVRESADIAAINAHQWNTPAPYILKHFGIIDEEKNNE